MTAALGVVSCEGPRTQIPTVSEIISPARAPSGEPNLTLGDDGLLYLTWIERDSSGAHTLLFSTLDSVEWSNPRAIAFGSDWFVNWADFPALAVDRQGTMLATWLERTGTETYAYGVRASISPDHGKTWRQPFWIHSDSTDTEHGFVSTVPANPSGFHIVWLDGRAMVNDGPMALRHALINQDGAILKDVIVDERVCDCCQTSLVRTGARNLLVAYRDRSEDEVRDISIAHYDGDSWSARATLPDQWKIAGCPVNGPALSASESEVALAWFTAARGDTGEVYVGSITRDGQGPTTAGRVDGGSPIGRVDVALNEDGALYYSWIEQSGSSATVMIGRAWPDGTRQSISAANTSVDRESGFPHICHWNKRVVVAWTDPDLDRVRTKAVFFR